MRYPIYWMNNLLKDFRRKRSKTSEKSHGTLVINRFRHVWGFWLTWWQIYYVTGDGQWYLFSNWMLQLVIRTQITFGSIILFLCWILSKFVHFLLKAIWILNFKPDDQKCYFQTRRYIGVSSKQCIVYRLTDVYRYVSIYWFTPSHLSWKKCNG